MTALPGIGPKQAPLWGRLLDREHGGARVIDLLFHMPASAVDRTHRPKLRDVVPGEVVTVAVTIDRHHAPPRGRSRAPHRIYAHDETGDLLITYFNLPAAYLARLLPVGSQRVVSGRAAMWDGMLQMAHPDHVVDERGAAGLLGIEPVYGLTEGLTGRVVAKAVGAALAAIPALPEWQEPAALAHRGWPAFRAALEAVHRPEAAEAAAPEGAGWSRLAYDELLAGQLVLGLVRAHVRRPAGRPTLGDGRLRARIVAALPYALTPSQEQAVAEITRDLAGEERMLRLLQGDVGSGKTVVALLAAAAAVEAGRQVALMAPTEILARQHHATIAPFAAEVGIEVALVTGRERGRERAAVLERLAAGEIDIVVGTHALFQEEVRFRDLALAVIDEQHRFGVHQRLALAGKGEAVDVLVLTATPIPRTLVLTYFGDMDVSSLREKPAGRQPIDTRAVPLSRLEEVVAAVGRALDEGHRVYWVCPLVEDSETTDLAAAEERFAFLQGRFGAQVGLVHGRMKGADKDLAMARFAAGETGLLVATTVIEVGVDVPAASVMVIEHAERFGLAQLHQLRGRVGRGAARSTCLLLYRPPLGDLAKARLAIMRETEDGFRIAEEDLRLRGEGDVLGTRQSGMPGFRIARLDFHGALIEEARAEATALLARDPALRSLQGQAARLLLHLFEREDAIRLLQAG